MENPVQKNGNPVPVWMLRIMHSIYENRFNCKLEVNFREGQCVQDQIKITLSAEKVLEACKPPKTY